jgi:hypothetical protein
MEASLPPGSSWAKPGLNFLPQNFSTAEMPTPGAWTTVGTQIKGDPVPIAYWTERRSTHVEPTWLPFSQLNRKAFRPAASLETVYHADQDLGDGGSSRSDVRAQA